MCRRLGVFVFRNFNNVYGTFFTKAKQNVIAELKRLHIQQKECLVLPPASVSRGRPNKTELVGGGCTVETYLPTRGTGFRCWNLIFTASGIAEEIGRVEMVCNPTARKKSCTDHEWDVWREIHSPVEQSRTKDSLATRMRCVVPY